MINLGITDSELNFNFRLFCKTVSKSANWGFDRFRIYGNSWSTRIQVRRPDGSVVDTQYFNSNYQFEHDFSFDLSENVNNEEYSVYIAGVPSSAKISQVYAFPTGFGATTGKNAEISYWDLAQVSPAPDGAGQIGRLRLENNPVTQIDGAANIQAGEIRLNNCQLGAENLADLLIGADNYGNSNGTFNYSGNSAAPAGRALAAYNNLKDVKAWAMTGDVPVNFVPEQETTAYMNAIAIPNDNTIYYGGTAQEILGNQIWEAVDVFVKSLKTDALYAQMKAIYPFIGATANKHKFNLKSPLDTNADFRLSFFGSWVQSRTGIKPNGANTYADTFFVPNVELSASNSIGVYSRENLVSSTLYEVDLGSQENIGNGNLSVSAKRSGTGKSFSRNYSDQKLEGLVSDARGFFISTRESDTNSKSYKNSTLLAEVLNAQSNKNKSTLSLYLGGLNSTFLSDTLSIRELSFAFISTEYLSSVKIQKLYTAVQNLQTALKRQV